MKILIILCLSFAAVLFLSCDRKEKRGICFQYPKEVLKRNLEDLYDSARLYIFTWVCDEQMENIYRAQFDLQYTDLLLRNDTVEFFFIHSFPEDSTKHIVNRYRTSFAFNVKKKKKLWGYDINGFSKVLDPGEPRFETFNSPEVIDFVTKHKSILNPCFFELAIESKLIK